MPRTLRLFVACLLIAIAIGALDQPAGASHSWGGYHWGRTANPFTLRLGDNVTSSWDGYLSVASADWSVSSVLDTTIAAGGTTSKRCQPTSGRVEVCNASYGRNGWLGVAQIWISGSHITQGIVKVNDTYFSMSAYNTAAWRQFVMCQEIGHTFGLGHTDETHTNANQGTCMDYTNDPDGGPGGASPSDASNEHPNSHDYGQLETIYGGHLDASSTVGASSGQTAGASGRAIPDPSGAETGGVSAYATELGGGKRVVTFVIWADANIIGAQHAATQAPIAAATEVPTEVVESTPAPPVDTAPLDSDGDGLLDTDETNVYGTNPQLFDTDGDGVGDGDEVNAGTDPLNAPAAEPQPAPGFAVGDVVSTAVPVSLVATPSRQGDLVAELPAGAQLTVTGAPEDAQGVTWVPVSTADGLSGYVPEDSLLKV